MIYNFDSSESRSEIPGKFSKCGAGEGWRKSVGVIKSEMSRRKGLSYIPQKERTLTVLVTSCVVSAF